MPVIIQQERVLESLTPAVKCSGLTDTHHVYSQFVRTSHMASAGHNGQETQSYTKYLEGRDLEIPIEQHTGYPNLYLTYDRFHEESNVLFLYTL